MKVDAVTVWLTRTVPSGANLCFFAGNVSAWVAEQGAYLVDGVAINGVSSGPGVPPH
jgi:hypothetical protein